MSFENIGTYTLQMWNNDRKAQEKQPLSCLVCYQDNNYRAYHETNADRRYRFCKHCGFYQDVDGDPIQQVLTKHRCVDLSEGEQCDRCGKWGSRKQHLCVKALRPEEFGTDLAKCDRCGTAVIENDEIHWPVSVR